MNAGLPQSYNPREFEEAIYREWTEKGYFRSSPDPEKKPYTIVIPPPNVTGMLHMGHILNNTIQDILIRYHRMNGYEACWIPGTDHASIATEAKVVKWLAESGITKEQIGREKFLEYAQDWKDKYGGIIIGQLKRMGASCDWDRLRFTMDDGYYKAVIHAFVDLYKKGKIYKGYRLVNWCPVSKSAISEEEVYYKEVKGSLWHIKYAIKGTDETITIATTRPETLLGDTAVAVNPKDKRYKHLVGKTAILPIADREIPVIADEYIDIDFGTGALKVTPAHDLNDYELAKKHDLQIINIMNIDATLNDRVPEEFRGMDRYEAREAVVEKLRELKLLVKIEDYTNNVGYSERGHVPIEPLLSEQWFMRMEELIKPAVEKVKDGSVHFYPERWVKTYFHWLENIRDWCISRQLWWGHRIPVYYCQDCGHFDAYEEAPKKCEKCGSAHLRQDEDVLDTWASSWIWPFAVHKWPEIDKDLEYYYPTSALVTAPDIIFFWVARMIIAGMEFLGKIPFEKVYFTGLIRDEQGRKMSKSLGNSPDPLDVIAEFGADALRYTIIRLAPLGNDILYSNEKCELGRNFANKIWNASKYILQNAESVEPGDIRKIVLDDIDKWILTRYEKTIEKARAEIEGFHFNEATISLYDFIWGEFCDWYIEASKIKIYNGTPEEKAAKVTVLLFILEGSLKLLHPVMPFITEKIYQTLPGTDGTIMRAEYPVYDKALVFGNEERDIEWVKQLIYTIRNIRGEKGIPPHVAVAVRIGLDDPSLQARIDNNRDLVLRLPKVESLDFVPADYAKADNEVAGTGPGFNIFISLEGLIDVEKEREKLTKEVARVEGSIKGTKAKLSNGKFVGQAPADIVQKERDKLAYLETELDKLKSNLAALK
ncbi:MAG: valine--tRNA ligase [Spirochaetes bacterium GWF1_51_8]|nr:MAG: valine--tRNA ligase [Spirochaetes bacterium GWF1_51_8]